MTSKTANSIPDFIAQQRGEIERLCRQFSVSRLEIFGSAVTGEFDDARSDIDFLMEFEKGFDSDLKLDAYFAFKASLEELFGRHVDLVFFSAVRNPLVRDSMQVQRTLLYAA